MVLRAPLGFHGDLLVDSRSKGALFAQTALPHYSPFISSFLQMSKASFTHLHQCGGEQSFK
jgi:hypothetical protein